MNGIVKDRPRRANQGGKKTVEKETSPEMDLHIIVDNDATHKHENVRKWLKRNKRVQLHFIPSRSSWLNLVERSFGLLTEKPLRRGVFTPAKELETQIKNFIDHHNHESKPFVWTKSANKILEKVDRARKALPLACSV